MNTRLARLRSAPLGSGRLRPAPAGSGRLRPAPAGSDRLRPAPAGSMQISVAMWSHNVGVLTSVALLSCVQPCAAWKNPMVADGVNNNSDSGKWLKAKLGFSIDHGGPVLEADLAVSGGCAAHCGAS